MGVAVAGDELLGLGSGMLLGGLLTTSLATALAGYRLPLQWPLVTMIAAPVVSTLAAAAAAAVATLDARPAVGGIGRAAPDHDGRSRRVSSGR